MFGSVFKTLLYKTRRQLHNLFLDSSFLLSPSPAPIHLRIKFEADRQKWPVGILCTELFHTFPAFQRFAVRTSKQIENISKQAVQKRQELAEQIKDISKNMEDSFKSR
ncbi:hypothetical protein Ahy_A04g019122 isoform C [Arachis hypogaea]|uniref:Uncharacterized protein n=1 Tax=Arachis hypogaea TaxID=3818 RepID=A0A445DFC2_ARAHY|nr:hypothetical protein Ahy_A04g019122 isoform C [Arachis hypogaea]